jgi:hypothetical protein
MMLSGILTGKQQWKQEKTAIKYHHSTDMLM